MPKKIVVKESRLFKESTSEIITIPETTLILEHSLLSISKWESKWHKPYLDTTHKEKSYEEALDYIKCMCISNNVKDEVFAALTQENIDEIAKYIEDPMTATTFSSFEEEGGAPSREIITSELIYYWMDVYQINWQAEKWPLNRLITLVRVHQAKSEKPKKMTPTQIMKRNAALNAKRRAEMNSKG